MSDADLLARALKAAERWNDPASWLRVEKGSLILWDEHCNYRFSAKDLRDMANALDGMDEATAAMIHDLQEESTAYQRGVEDGKNAKEKEIRDAIFEKTRQMNNLVAKLAFDGATK